MKDRIKENGIEYELVGDTIFRYWNFQMKSIILENMAGCTGSI